MKFTAFQIKNYKGINDTTISLSGNKGSIYTLVGLNESGKTTILEAINNFRHDVDGIHAIAQRGISTGRVEALVPKKRKDNFNGEISVAANVRLEKREVATLAERCKSTYGFEIAVDRFPLEFSVTRAHHFENSAHTESTTEWDLYPSIKKKRARKFRTLDDQDPEWQDIVREIGRSFPRIVYFPTFLFDFPERIMVSEGESEFEGNEYFKAMIEDALASLDDPLDLEKHIVDRVVKTGSDQPFDQWTSRWTQSDERERVASALAKLSRKISEEIFGRWKDVLGSEVGKKELVIEHLVDVGTSEERQVFLTFKVKDGYQEFKVAERSLGFRWFFCFLLFTRFFRGSEYGESVFLFDEPASNLHSKAQSKLLDSLKVISAGRNDIIYSTHSHHLVNPLWLETAFVVTNGEPTDGTAVDANFGIEDTDIRAQSYKAFVGQNAEKGHYFQPILDRLQVAPSVLEAVREGVLTEGKSDYYILNWYKKYHCKKGHLDFVPVGGVTNAGTLMSLYLGLARRFVFLVDSDRKGQEARKRYVDDLPISEKAIVGIGEVFRSAKKKTIEDVISASMKDVIAKKYLVRRATKKHILRAFAEALAGENDLPSDEETLSNLKTLVGMLTERLDR